jgi:hypothetical protein
VIVPTEPNITAKSTASESAPLSIRPTPDINAAILWTSGNPPKRAASPNITPDEAAAIAVTVTHLPISAFHLEPD